MRSKEEIKQMIENSLKWDRISRRSFFRGVMLACSTEMDGKQVFHETIITPLSQSTDPIVQADARYFQWLWDKWDDELSAMYCYPTATELEEEY